MTGMEKMAAKYLEWLEARNYSGDTVKTRSVELAAFGAWCLERSIDDPREVTRPVLERYQSWMFHYRKKNGQPLSARTQHVRLQGLKNFFQWLARQNWLLHNPASEMVLPRMEFRLPKYILSAAEAERVIGAADAGVWEGLRDRAILETFYSTGMRRMELAGLKAFDVDHDRQVVTIRMGKGKKDRMIPIGERALGWIARYSDEVRGSLVTGADDGTLFLNNIGQPFERMQLTELVRKYIQRAKIGKTGGCHLFRHTMATLMLENGADIRVIQQMLGHASLDTTQLYTRVSINLLRQVYADTHPAAQRHSHGEPGH
jgi:integrase/recombinase XerD